MYDHFATGNWNGSGNSSAGRYFITPLHPIYCEGGDRIKIIFPEVTQSTPYYWNIKVWWLSNTLSFGTTTAIKNYLVGSLSDYVYVHNNAFSGAQEMIIETPTSAMAFQMNIGIYNATADGDIQFTNSTGRTRVSSTSLYSNYFGKGTSGTDMRNIKFKFEWQ